MITYLRVFDDYAHVMQIIRRIKPLVKKFDFHVQLDELTLEEFVLAINKHGYNDIHDLKKDHELKSYFHLQVIGPKIINGEKR